MSDRSPPLARRGLAGLPDEEDERDIRAAIARLGDRREIRRALSALERLRRGLPRPALAG